MTPTDDHSAPTVDVALSEQEETAVAETLQALLDVLPYGDQSPYADLAAVVPRGTVPAAQVPALERVCVLALQTGKARQLGRAEAERLLAGILGRTPTGRQQSQETTDVNRVLEHLTGRTLDSVRVSSRVPGHYQFHLGVDGVQIAIAFTPDGVQVNTVQTG